MKTDLTGTTADPFTATTEDGEEIQVTKEYIGINLVLKDEDDNTYTANDDGTITKIDAKQAKALEEADAGVLAFNEPTSSSKASAKTKS